LAGRFGEREVEALKPFGCVSGFFALACIAAVAVVFAPVSAAADRERITGSFSFTTNNICVDPIRVKGSFDEMMHTFYDNDGNAVRISFTGAVAIKFTNLTTGATYSPNSSGPGTVDLASGQSIVRGSNGAIVDANGNLIATNGRLVLDADGNIISIVGHQTDVCTKLGSAPAP
jgi:hypothetical protein